ncbi:MAG TPA: cysteine--tRNA ligase [Acidimicrobiales bacterium]|nr:cysteine--tRNA ligase [Acidimicrobiales bacterium]
MTPATVLLMLALLDTVTGRVEPLQPRSAGKLSVYACGPTVAGVPHIGHARANLVWDSLRRYLTWSGMQVRFVSNVTDIEDKIIAKANDEGTTTDEVAQRYEALWRQTMDRLGVQRPDDVPHATEYVERMVDLVGDLVGKSSAYVAGDGVYFSTASLDGYGLLAHQSLESLRAGARVEVDEEVGKRSPLDFVLWKLSKPGEPSWPSPWGPGRPGWHTECVVMSLDLLGEGFDLHVGGLDLAFPHHENERAQAVASGAEFARRWAHNGMVNDERGEKMSRSVGNVLSLPNLLDHYEGRELRYFMLQTHYRRPMAVSEDGLEQARASVRRFDNFLWEMRDAPAVTADHEVVGAFRARLDDDFDTPGAIGVLFGAVNTARSDAGRAPSIAAAVRECLGSVGVFSRDGQAQLGEREARLVAERDEARRQKDWATADAKRAELAAMGYVVSDGPDGTAIRPA